MPSSQSIFGFGRAARAASASSALASAAAAEAANEDTHALTRVETSSHTTCITETEGQRAARAASAMEVDAPPTLGPPVALAGLAEAEMRDAAAVASSAARKASESARRDVRVQLEDNDAARLARAAAGLSAAANLGNLGNLIVAMRR